MVGVVNQLVAMAAALTDRQSKRRCNERCAQYKEEIMMKAWHPSRMAMLLEMGYDVEDM
jgi:hypothetical protein